MARTTSSSTHGRGDQSPRLREVKSLSEPMRRSLEALDITHVDQLRGVASVPDARQALLEQLEVSPADFTRALADVGDGRGGAEAAAVEPPPRFTLGALLPPPSARALSLSIPFSSTRTVLARLPASANLIPKFSPVRNQGNRGACVAFSLTAIHEYAVRTAEDYSERDLYYAAKRIDGSPGACGTTQAAASQALASSGQCLESAWSYNPNADCNAHGTPPGSPSRQTQGLVALNPHDIVAIKTALADKRPVAISVPVYNSWFQSPAVARTGRITMPIVGESDVGGHCMCIVGYQDDGPATVTETPGGGFFILRNSWGTTLWGSQCPFGAGYGTIPYGYIAAFNWEAYTLPPTRRRRGTAKKTTPARKTSRGGDGGATAKRATSERDAAKRSAAKRSTARRGAGGGRRGG